MLPQPQVLRFQPIRPRPSSLDQQLGRRLESLGLILNSPEPAIICRSCRFTLVPSGDSVSRHLAEKHNVSKAARRGLSHCINALNLPHPEKLPLRQNGSPPHPHLHFQRGAVCSVCDYKTTSFDLIRRHSVKSHGRRQSDACECYLQGWLKNGARGLWIVHLPLEGVVDHVLVDSIPGSLDNNLHASNETATLRQSRVEELHHAEHDRLTETNERSAAAAMETGGQDMALINNWMRHTGWNEMFATANRALLVRLTQLPCCSKSGLHLGTYEEVERYSCRDDEKRLAHIVTALNGVFDRCEDTVKHTDNSLRCWLRGHTSDRPFPAAFELVGRKSTTRGYRRLMERFVCFCFRLWRLEAGIRERLIKRSLTKDQCKQLMQVWSHDLWSTRRDDAQPQTDEPDGDCEDDAWSSSNESDETESELSDIDYEDYPPNEIADSDTMSQLYDDDYSPTEKADWDTLYQSRIGRAENMSGAASNQSGEVKQ